MDQLPLENLENNRIELLFCQNTLIGSFCQKLISCGENGWLWEIGGVFDNVINFYWNNSLYLSTSVFDLEIGNWGWFAKTNQVVAKNDPYKQFWVLIWIDFVLVLLALYYVGINHQKGGVKGN
jgi:hypothetical protein